MLRMKLYRAWSLEKQMKTTIQGLGVAGGDGRMNDWQRLPSGKLRWIHLHTGS